MPASNAYDTLLASLNPTAWWKLADNTSSYAAWDWTGYNYNGAVTGGVTLQESGPIVGAPGDTSMLFDGSTGEVSINTSLGSFPTTGSVCFWMNPSRLHNYDNPFNSAQIANYNNQIRFEMTTTQFGVIIGNGSSFASGIYAAPMVVGKWYFIGLTWNQTTNTMTGYLNGVQVFSTTCTTWPTTTMQPTIGNGFDGTRYFNGYVAQAAVFDGTVLTGAQWSALYTASQQPGTVVSNPNVVTAAGTRLNFQNLPYTPFGFNHYWLAQGGAMTHSAVDAFFAALPPYTMTRFWCGQYWATLGTGSYSWSNLDYVMESAIAHNQMVVPALSIYGQSGEDVGITGGTPATWTSGSNYTAGTWVNYTGSAGWQDIYYCLHSVTSDTVPPPCDPTNWSGYDQHYAYYNPPGGLNGTTGYNAPIPGQNSPYSFKKWVTDCVTRYSPGGAQASLASAIGMWEIMSEPECDTNSVVQSGSSSIGTTVNGTSSTISLGSTGSTQYLGAGPGYGTIYNLVGGGYVDFTYSSITATTIVGVQTLYGGSGVIQAGTLFYVEEPATNALRIFFDNIGGLIRSIDPYHLIESGVIGGNQAGMEGGDYGYIHNSSGMDVCCYHDYSGQTPITGLTGGSGTLVYDLEQAEAINKPLLCGESGIGNVTDPTGNTPAANATQRAQWFWTKFTTQVAEYGAAGILAWAFDPSSDTGLNITYGDPLYDDFVGAAAPVVTGVSPNSGPSLGGTSVVISGENLYGAVSIHFDYAAATSWTVLNNTSIQLSTPAQTAGYADVTVGTQYGISAINSADQFLYVFTPALIPSPDTVWTVLFGDLRTNTITAELPVNNLQFTSVLNGVGSLSGTINMADARVQAADASDVLIPGRTQIWVDLNGVLVWGGILWTTSYDNTTRLLTIGGQDFFSYFYSSRRVTFDITSTGVFIPLPVDPLVFVESLINILQDEYGGSINTIVPTNTSGQLIPDTFSIQGSQYLQVGQAIQQVAQQSGLLGFDYMIDVAWNGSTPTNSLTLSYPRRGRTGDYTSVVFDVGATSCTGYVWPTDSTKQANIVYGIGAGSGSTALSSTQEDEAIIDSGWPILEDSYSRTDINDQDTLDAVTISYLDAESAPVSLPQITVTADGDPQFGTYIVGDDCRIIIPPDEYWTTGLDEFWRISGWTVNVADQGVTTVQNTFCVPPVIV